MFGREDKIEFKELDSKLPDWLVLDKLSSSMASYVRYEDGKLRNHTNMLFSIETGADLKGCWYYFKNDAFNF